MSITLNTYPSPPRSTLKTVFRTSVSVFPVPLRALASAIRNEQTANARGLVEAGAAVMIQEAGLDAPGLSQHIARILSDPAQATAMAAAALSLGKPDAATELADIVEDLAGAQYET